MYVNVPAAVNVREKLWGAPISPESHTPGGSSEVVECSREPTHTQLIVVPTGMFDVLVPETWSRNRIPSAPAPTLTVRVPPAGGVGVGVGAGGVAVRVAVGPGGVGVDVAPGVMGCGGWSSAPITKIGSVVALSMTAAYENTSPVAETTITALSVAKLSAAVPAAWKI